MTAPSRVMRSASHLGTWPLCSGRSALPALWAMMRIPAGSTLRVWTSLSLRAGGNTARKAAAQAADTWKKATPFGAAFSWIAVMNGAALLFVEGGRSDQDIAFSGMVGRSDDALLLHALHQRGGPVVADLQPALDVGGRGLL